MGIMIQAGNPLGYTIQAAEIDDGSITAAKLGTGWKLQVSGLWSATTACLDLQDLPLKKGWRLLLKVEPTANDTLNLTMNGDQGNNYRTIKILNTTLSQVASTTCQLALLCANRVKLMDLQMSGNADATGRDIQYISMSYDGNDGVYLGGTHANNAALSRITITTQSNSTGIYALYYNQDLEVAQ